MSTGVEHSSCHAAALQAELDWLVGIIELRLKQHFQAERPDVERPSPPALPPDSALGKLVEAHQLDADARLVLALALAPHLRPEALDPFFVRNKALDRGFSEFGGWKGQRHGGFLPTGETAAFLVAAGDLDRRIALLKLFDDAHPFAEQNLVRLNCDLAGEPQLSGTLDICAEALQRLLTGSAHKPDYNAQFPARLMRTPLGWDDLILPAQVMEEIQLIRTWLERGPELMNQWGLARAVKPGYRCLFYGPPGTGKTLTATLLGQSADVDVYRIDLSLIVSKYIGETEKNLARVFDQAQSRHWILFFDEADALFGKRGSTQSSNDRHANQEVAYLLQRVEDFPGVVILASNLRANIDDAFSRRFQSMIHFPMPDANQRLRLWQGLLGNPERLAPDIDLAELAEKYEIAGGAIVNILRYAALQAARQGLPHMTAAHFQQGLGKELRKEGKTL